MRLWPVICALCVSWGCSALNGGAFTFRPMGRFAPQGALVLALLLLKKANPASGQIYLFASLFQFFYRALP